MIYILWRSVLLALFCVEMEIKVQVNNGGTKLSIYYSCRYNAVGIPEKYIQWPILNTWEPANYILHKMLNISVAT